MKNWLVHEEAHNEVPYYLETSQPLKVLILNKKDEAN